MQPGDLIGEFTIVRQIGEGGMAIVCLAEHQSDRTQVVVKQLRDQLAFDRQLVERFAQSAQIMRELRHPHLARVIEYLERDGRYFVVEEYLAGGSLADLLDRGDPYPERDALCWCRDALRAVNYAHENGIVHRDLKPGNLMLDDQRRVKVTDFGIARVFGGPRLTRTGREMGTPTYMSPEQIRSPHQVDHLTDVYSMGVVLYELLTHRVPFDGESDFEIKSQVVRDPPVPPRQIAPSLSPRLEAIVLKAVAKEPADRFGGCAEFALELESCMTRGAPGAVARWRTGAWIWKAIGYLSAAILVLLVFRYGWSWLAFPSIVLGSLSSVAFLAELVLFGRGTVHGTRGSSLRRGDRVARWLVLASERMKRVGTSPVATVWRWLRRALLVVVPALVVMAVLQILGAEPERPTFTPPGSIEEAAGQGCALVLGVIAFEVLRIVALILIPAIGLAMLAGAYLIQVVFFGAHGHPPAASTILNYMGNHVRGILWTAGAVGAVSGVVGVLVHLSS